MPIKPIQPRPVQYKPLHDPGLMNKTFLRRQQRHDKAVEAQNRVIEEAVAKGTFSEDDKEAYLNEIQGDFDRTIEKYDNNLAKGYNEIRDKVREARTHPYRALNQKALQLAQQERKLKAQFGPRAISRQSITEQSLRDEEGDWKSPEELSSKVIEASQYQPAARKSLEGIKAKIREKGLSEVPGYESMLQATSVKEFTPAMVEKAAALSATSGEFASMAPTYAVDNRDVVNPKYDEEGNFIGNQFTSPEIEEDASLNDEGNVEVDVAGETKTMTPEEYGQYKYIRDVNMDRVHRNIQKSYRNNPQFGMEEDEDENGGGDWAIPVTGKDLSEKQNREIESTYTLPDTHIVSEGGDGTSDDISDYGFGTSPSATARGRKITPKKIDAWFSDLDDQMDNSQFSNQYKKQKEKILKSHGLNSQEVSKLTTDSEKFQRIKSDLKPFINTIKEIDKDMNRKLSGNLDLHAVSEDASKSIAEQAARTASTVDNYDVKAEDRDVNLSQMSENDIEYTTLTDNGGIKVTGEYNDESVTFDLSGDSSEAEQSHKGYITPGISDELDLMNKIKKSAFSPKNWEESNSSQKALTETKPFRALGDKNGKLIRQIVEKRNGDFEVITGYTNGKEGKEKETYSLPELYQLLGGTIKGIAEQQANQ